MGDIRTTICPKCKGWQRVVEPFSLKQDGLCDLCAGNGWLFDILCVGCGRPATMESGEIWHCGRKDCIQAAEDEAKLEKPILRTSIRSIDRVSNFRDIREDAIVRTIFEAN